MFNRDIISDLRKWAIRDDRKPLVLRGARQVGKTTAIQLFAQDFDQFIHLNLEKIEERLLFEKQQPFSDLLMAVFLYSQKERFGKRTLLFIDEIQNSAKAIALLRYFYEESSDLFVIAAGSLLETIMNRQISLPVGRVEYMMMYPVSFREFLIASNDLQSLKLLEDSNVPGYAHLHLTDMFQKYSIIGGMPQVVDSYIKKRDLTVLRPLFESLLHSYAEDVEKYAATSFQVQYIRHIMATAFVEAGNRITIENFGNSAYKYREMKEAFNALEKTLLIRLIYPLSEQTVPALPNMRLKPRLHVLDTGLINYSVGLIQELLLADNLSDVYRGRIAEHVVGQELLAKTVRISSNIQFWVRNKKQSHAEIDYIVNFQGHLIPVEVKSGSIGRLRSLHVFMDQAPHGLAVRVWQGPYSVETAQTINGKVFKLINLPFYMVHRIELELAKHV
jgi:uncharacterized protein